MVPYGTKGSGLVGVATSESDETIGRSDRVVSHRIASHLIHLYHFTSKKQQDATDVLYFALVFGMASVTPKKRNASPDPFYKKQQLLSSLERWESNPLCALAPIVLWVWRTRTITVRTCTPPNKYSAVSYLLPNIGFAKTYSSQSLWRKQFIWHEIFQFCNSVLKLQKRPPGCRPRQQW